VMMNTSATLNVLLSSDYRENRINNEKTAMWDNSCMAVLIERSVLIFLFYYS
jgi:hypothetical protein